MREENLRFEIVKEDEKTGARAGLLYTPHGTVETPVFMPVGTQGTVKTMSPRELEEAGVQMIVCNVYHLYLRPGHGLIREAGGIHRFIGWRRPVLSDSGGFQVFSLADLREIDKDGVKFQSHLNGSFHLFTPEKVMEIEGSLSPDIGMVLDEPVPYPSAKDYAASSMELTVEWARRARACKDGSFGLFGIVQGGTYPDLRRSCAEMLVELDFPGYAIGGLAIGEPKVLTMEMVELTVEKLPKEKPRYLMGVGLPEDMIDAFAVGVDMFDCVIPTRNGRTGTVFNSSGKLVIKNAEYSSDHSPIDLTCGCYACRNFSRAYIRHLFNAGEILAARLATMHNIHFFAGVVSEMRKALMEDRLTEWKKHFSSKYDTKKEVAE
ncbi:MAG: tRNA guanosine(34) transglycosylase Tgt [bacterium]